MLNIIINLFDPLNFFDLTHHILYNTSDSINTIIPIQSIILAFLLFLIGILGIIFNKKSLINIMLAIELMYLGINLSFIFFSIMLNNPKGQLFAMILLAIIAAESALGLGLLIVAFRLKGSIYLRNFKKLKG